MMKVAALSIVLQASLTLLLSSEVDAFVVYPTTPGTRKPTSLAADQPEQKENGMLSDLQSRIKSFGIGEEFGGDGTNAGPSMPNIDVSSFSSLNAQEIGQNVMDGELGKRGEAYVAAQFALLLFILIGDVPVVDSVVRLLLGPGLLVVGLVVIVLSLPALGPNLSPWPVPPSSKDASLVTDGLYEKVRHPLYAGLIASCTGFSMITDSAMRLALTGVLLYVLDIKSDYEEKELANKFSEYNTYKQNVKGKFFPEEFLESMPWRN